MHYVNFNVLRRDFLDLKILKWKKEKKKLILAKIWENWRVVAQHEYASVMVSWFMPYILVD